MANECSNNPWGRSRSDCNCNCGHESHHNSCANLAREIRRNIDEAEKMADCTQKQLAALRQQLERIEKDFDRLVREGCIRDTRRNDHDCDCGCNCR